MLGTRMAAGPFLKRVADELLRLDPAEVQALADVMFAIGFALWRVRRLVQRKPDTDPPKLLSDFVRNSVFVRGAAV